jgi:hypothetical protein
MRGTDRCWLAAVFVCAVAAQEEVQCEESYPPPKFSDAQFHTLRVLTIISATFSFLGSCFTISTYVRFERLRTFAFKLVMLLSIADCIASLHFLFGAYHDVNKEWQTHHCPSIVCFITAAAYQFAQVSSFLWTACIAYNIYAALQNIETESLEPYYHLVSWGGSLVLVLIVSVTGSLGYSGNWCWIRQDRPLARIMFYFVPLISVMFYDMWMYVRIGQKVAQSPVEDIVNKRLRRYIGVFLFLNTFSVVNRLQNMMGPETPSFLLYLLQSFFSPMQGFANALVYGWNRRVVAEYSKEYPRFCACFCSCCEAIQRRTLVSFSTLTEQGTWADRDETESRQSLSMASLSLGPLQSLTSSISEIQEAVAEAELAEHAEHAKDGEGEMHGYVRRNSGANSAGGINSRARGRSTPRQSRRQARFDDAEAEEEGGEEEGGEEEAEEVDLQGLEEVGTIEDAVMHDGMHDGGQRWAVDCGIGQGSHASQADTRTSGNLISLISSGADGESRWMDGVDGGNGAPPAQGNAAFASMHHSPPSTQRHAAV